MTSEPKPEDILENAEGGPTELAGPEASASEVANLLGKKSGRTISQAIIIERTELFLETYSRIADWIKFADAKAAVVLTVNGALAGLLIPTLSEFQANADITSPLTQMAIVAFGVWLAFLIASGFYAFLCILPLRIKNQHPSTGHCANFHPAAITKKYSVDDREQFIADCTAGSGAEFERQVLTAVLLDSHISNVKYSRVSAAIKYFALSVIAAFIYLVTVQFVG